MTRFLYSLDFELGWGVIEYDLWQQREKNGVYTRLRDTLPQFLSFLEKHEIPLTWAVVGGMVTAPGELQFDHLPDSYREKIEAALSSSRSDTFDGRDVFEAVHSCKVQQSFASHTYSHCRLSYPEQSKDGVRSDLELGLERLKAHGVSTNRLVLPQNHEAHMEAVLEAGFEVVRTAPKTNSVLSKLAPAPIAEDEAYSDDLRAHAASMLYHFPIGGGMASLRKPLCEFRANRALSNAVSKGGSFHIWNHPFNLSENPKILNSVMHLLEKAARLRDAGKLEFASF